jgi:hypothetical protein
VRSGTLRSCPPLAPGDVGASPPDVGASASGEAGNSAEAAPVVAGADTIYAKDNLPSEVEMINNMTTPLVT